MRVGTWHDWIFVNLNGTAPPLEDYVAPIQHRLEGVDFSQMKHILTERLQRGRDSDVAAGGGVLSPVWEEGVRSFQERVVSRLL